MRQLQLKLAESYIPEANAIPMVPHLVRGKVKYFGTRADVNAASFIMEERCCIDVTAT